MGTVISDIDHKLGYLYTNAEKGKIVECSWTWSSRGWPWNDECSQERIIELDQYLDREHYTLIDQSPVAAILPREGQPELSGDLGRGVDAVCADWVGDFCLCLQVCLSLIHGNILGFNPCLWKRQSLFPQSLIFDFFLQYWNWCSLCIFMVVAFNHFGVIGYDEKLQPSLAEK